MKDALVVAGKSYSSRLLVGTTSGTWEASFASSGALTGWVSRDPIIEDSSLSGIQPDPQNYGSGLTACIGGAKPSFVVETDWNAGNFLWSYLDVPVKSP